MEGNSSKHFLSAHLLGGILSGVRLVSGFARMKYIALILGTTGVGLLAQGNQFNLLGITIGSLSMAVGIINRLASKDSLAEKQKLLSTAFTVQLTISLALVGVAVFGSGPLSELVLGVAGEGRKCVIVAAGLPLAVLASGYVEGIFFGMNRYDLYVRAAIASTVTGLIAFVPLVAFKGIEGAFWGIFANAACLFLSYLYFVSKIMPLGKVFRFGFEWSQLRRLLKFSFVMLVTGAAGYATTLLIRRQIISSLGLSANGIAQVPLAITAYYTPFLTNGLWGRLHPATSASGDTPAARAELASVLKLIVLFTTAVVVSILLFQEYLVRLAYSSAFLDALPLLPIQFLGDYFYFIAFTCSVYVLAMPRLRIYLACWLAYYVVLTAVSLFLLPHWGLKAFPIGYAISSSVFGLLALGWVAKASKVRDALGTISVVLACFLAVALQCYLTMQGYGFGVKVWVPVVLGSIAAYSELGRRQVSQSGSVPST
jgi:PST family polysaccharide transporter